MRRVDAVHGRARADERVERHHGFVRVFLVEAVDQVYFGADGDRGAGGCPLDRFDDEVGRAHLVGFQHRVMRAFGVHHHDAVRMFVAEGRDLFGPEPLMD